MLTKVFGAAVQGIDAFIVTIEVNTSRGIKFFLVGLPDNAVKESHERIISALSVNGYKFPTCQIIVNMAPAGVRKEGCAYDLPLALGIMASSKMISRDLLSDYLIIGELSLDGGVVPIKGALPITIKAKEDGFKGVILPYQNANEAAVVDGITVYGVHNISEVIEFLNGNKEIKPSESRSNVLNRQSHFEQDFEDVRGQESVKRALEVAAAGGHNLIMIGPPGSGKSMLAQRLPSILPPLTLSESLETTKIFSVAGYTTGGCGLITERPFRHPHHTISSVALVGGGVNAQPGEISLAHNGVLFLDEMPEFSRSVLEVLRQPLEDRIITISRSRYNVEYPASFMLIASMNPCPCGFLNHQTKICTCSPMAIQNYLNRISGPLLDRIDIQCEIVPVPFEKISSGKKGEPSNAIRERVLKAREIQNNRFRNEPAVFCNAQMNSSMLSEYATIEEDGVTMLKVAMERLNLSARAYNRILKVSRTIADLEGSEVIQKNHLAEAISYRSLDRGNWGK